MRDFRNPREQKALTRARRVKVRVAGLVALLGLSGAGLVYREAITQEVMGQYRWRVATGPTVLTVVQEKAKAGMPGFGLQGMCERLPGDDRRPGWQIHYGLAGDRVRPGSQ